MRKQDEGGGTGGSGSGGGDDLTADGMMTVQQAMAFTTLGKSEIFAMLRRGELPSAKLGKRRVIPRKAVVNLLNERLKAAEGEAEDTGRPAAKV